MMRHMEEHDMKLPLYPASMDYGHQDEYYGG
jgi:hypothetical protein